MDDFPPGNARIYYDQEARKTRNSHQKEKETPDKTIESYNPSPYPGTRLARRVNRHPSLTPSAPARQPRTRSQTDPVQSICLGRPRSTSEKLAQRRHRRHHPCDCARGGREGPMMLLLEEGVGRRGWGEEEGRSHVQR